MFATLLNGLSVAGSFVASNLKTVLITAAIATISFFVIGYFRTKAQLAATQFELALADAQVAQLKIDVKDIKVFRDELAKKTAEFKKKESDLVAQLNRDGKKPISELAERHAKLVENAVNRGTEKALRCLETVSKGGDC